MRSDDDRTIGLVLGAGGVLGAAWLVGALHAIASETGWDPGSCSHVVGTSAGAIVGSLLAAGVPPWLMVANSAGEALEGLLDANGEPVEPADHWTGARWRIHGGFPALGPGSWRLAVGSLARPYRHSPAALVAGVLPDGLVSTEPIRRVVRNNCTEPWAPHPNFWAIAVDYRSGRRVVFGRDGAPAAELPEAVAASCAIPGFYRSVSIGGRHYIDGGLHSTSNLDVLADAGLDLVICLTPMSSLHATAPRTVGERLAFALRQTSGRRLNEETERVRAAGTDVVLIQPTVHDLDAMGSNLMSRGRRHAVIETAVRTVTEHLRESPVGTQLAVLPAGISELVRRPPGPITSWPDLHAAARRRHDRSAGGRRAA